MSEFLKYLYVILWPQWNARCRACAAFFEWKIKNIFFIFHDKSISVKCSKIIWNENCFFNTAFRFLFFLIFYARCADVNVCKVATETCSNGISYSEVFEVLNSVLHDKIRHADDKPMDSIQFLWTLKIVCATSKNWRLNAIEFVLLSLGILLGRKIVPYFYSFFA